MRGVCPFFSFFNSAALPESDTNSVKAIWKRSATAENRQWLEKIMSYSCIPSPLLRHRSAKSSPIGLWSVNSWCVTLVLLLYLLGWRGLDMEKHNKPKISCHDRYWVSFANMGREGANQLVTHNKYFRQSQKQFWSVWFSDSFSHLLIPVKKTGG